MRELARLQDANANRACEGLRVLEDVARFLLDDGAIAERAKVLRHQLRHLVPAAVPAGRAAGEDAGAAIPNPDAARPRLVALVRANAARVQEAVRVLEEAARLEDPVQATALESCRFRAYQLESALLSRLPAWQLHRVLLYALVDASLTSDPVRSAGQVARGGAGAVQLRAKELTPARYHALAQAVQAAVAPAGALFIVNDHVAVARALDADGIHVGQDDLPVADVRRVVGPCCAIGVSAHTPEQAREACAAGADYLGLGPMFPTATKPHEPCRGPELLDAVRPWLQVPSYAIGGLDEARIAQLRPRLPHGVAVAGALLRDPDPEAAAARIHRLLQPEDM